MSGEINFYLNKASEGEILNHLWSCDADFMPPLSIRVEMSDYTHKIAKKATRFEAWVDELVGMLAVYCNDSEHRIAYITNVSVLPPWKNKGIASGLLERCIEHVKERGFEQIELEVDEKNTGAIQLYKNHGFMVNRTSGSTMMMHLHTGKGIP
jgi:ribosomal protein S18 acetylase RimI-like enzyme